MRRAIALDGVHPAPVEQVDERAANIVRQETDNGWQTARAFFASIPNRFIDVTTHGDDTVQLVPAFERIIPAFDQIRDSGRRLTTVIDSLGSVLSRFARSISPPTNREEYWFAGLRIGDEHFSGLPEFSGMRLTIRPDESILCYSVRVFHQETGTFAVAQVPFSELAEQSNPLALLLSVARNARDNVLRNAGHTAAARADSDWASMRLMDAMGNDD